MVYIPKCPRHRPCPACPCPQTTRHDGGAASPHLPPNCIIDPKPVAPQRGVPCTTEKGGGVIG
eukprot:4202285-Pyramimonas_sp.AAC.1